MNYVYIFGSVILVSLLSILSVLPLLLQRNANENVLVALLGVSAGTLLGGAFIHFIPRIAMNGYTLWTAFYILAGFMSFFILEKLVHHHHDETLEPGHSHAYHLAPVNIVGDGIHNLIDGMVIAGGYIASTSLGVAATVSVIFHEIPQEIADFGVLLYAGLSKKKAVIYNFLSAITALVGAGIAVVLAGQIDHFTTFIIPFATGNFLYIAASNLVPEMMQQTDTVESTLQVLALTTGLAVMALLHLL